MSYTIIQVDEEGEVNSITTQSDTTTVITTVDIGTTVIESIGIGPQGTQGEPGVDGAVGPIGPIGASGGASGTSTLLSVTGSKVSGSVYSITSSGVNYTKSGDDGLFQDNAVTFNATTGITVSVNGVIQYKGVHVLWNSATSFILNLAVDNGDEILIIA